MKAQLIYRCKITTDYLSALINSDHTGLNEIESAMITDWEQDLLDYARDEGYHSVVYQVPDDITHIGHCHISSQPSCVYDVDVYGMKENDTNESLEHASRTSR